MRSPKLKITNIARIKQLRAGKDDFLERYLQYLENKVKNSITARLFSSYLEFIECRHTKLAMRQVPNSSSYYYYYYGQ